MEAPSLTPEQEFMLEEEGEPSSVYDDILGIVVEQGRMVAQLISCLAVASIAEPDTSPEPNMNSSTLDFIKNGGIYNFLVEEPNACLDEAGLATAESDFLLPSKRESAVSEEEPEFEIDYSLLNRINPNYQGIGDIQQSPPEAPIVKKKEHSYVAPDFPPDRKPTCCKCTIL